jgi:hypothetical protein
LLRHILTDDIMLVEKPPPQMTGGHFLTIESVFPSRVAEALPFPVIIGCCASLNGIADRCTW